ncbi:Ribonuclease H superfamily protein [Abortiporus biennis]
MVWGAIAEGKKGPLVLLDLGESDNEDGTSKGRRGLDGPRYVAQVIVGPLIGFYDEVVAERGEAVLVVEDGAPAHTSRVAKCAHEILNIHTLTHPPRSPDLNHIEPLWLLLKDHVADVPGSWSSIGKLWDAVQSVWNAFTEEKIAHVTGSMVERVNAVKAAKGHHTRF